MVTTIHSLFHRATADGHVYDGGGVSSFDSHFANISDRHEICTLMNVRLRDEIIHRQLKCRLINDNALESQ